MGELVPVRAIDGRTIGTTGSGPLTTRLCDLFRELTRSEGYRVVG